jgi:hypothetical protein
MGTRSHIGMLQPDGTVMAIYCHWDGYPEHNGKVLMEHYTDPEKIKALIALGSLSSLGPELGEKHKFEEHNDQWCTAHHRDRDEELRVDNHKNVDFYLCGKNDSYGGGEWRYLWDGTQWLGASEDGDTFIPIPELLKKNAEDDGD